MRVIVGPADDAQVALGDHSPGRFKGSPGNGHGRITAEIVGVGIGAHDYAIHDDLLADIPGDDVLEIPLFLQPFILPIGRPVRQVEGFGHILLDDFFIGVQGEEVFVKVLHVIPGLYLYIILPVFGYGGQHFPIGQKIDPGLGGFSSLPAFPDSVEADGGTGKNYNGCKYLNMAEGLVDMLHFIKHH